MPHKNPEDRKKWMQEKMKDPEYAEHVRARQRAYRQKNLEKLREMEKESYERHKDSKAERCKSWREKNPEKVRGYALRHRNKNKLNHNVRTLVWGSLKGKKHGRHWEDLVGYTVAELRTHLESLFQPGMSWDNYGRDGWHVDHIRPVSSFTFSGADCQEFKECWALSNLQPLWADENVRKSNKWRTPTTQADNSHTLSA